MSAKRIKSSPSDPFWSEEPSILLNRERVVEFFPTADQTLAERMNSISRLIIYIGVVLSLYQKKATPLHFALLMLVLIFFMWKNQTIAAVNNVLQHGISSSSDEVSVFPSPHRPYGEYEDDDPDLDLDLEYGKVPDKVETFAALRKPVLSQASNSSSCVMPTLENPFMNYLLGDDPQRPPACKGPGVQETAANLLDRQLFEDVNDLYNKNGNNRMFRTMPSTTRVPDRENFSRWLINGVGPNDKNCKQDGNCYPYTDLRSNRELIPEDLETELQVEGFAL
jgi:hypothetical protein